MAKSVIFVASAICLLSILGVSQARVNKFVVEGQVYCDTCRIQFPTRLSESLKGAKVRLECKDEEGGYLTYKVEGETDGNGMYRLAVEGDHEEEICEIVLVSSPDSKCAEAPKGEFLKNSAIISLTANNGIEGNVRAASPLGFLRSELAAECPKVIEELGLSMKHH